jgi:hypothetical protein
MAVYKTAMGKTVDMGSLMAKNERVRAVGNGKMNARGDTIDSAGKVIKPGTAKVNEIYSKTVGNRSSHVKSESGPVDQKRAKIITDDDLNVLTEQERELEQSMEDDAEIEKIKAKSTKGKK